MHFSKYDQMLQYEKCERNQITLKGKQVVVNVNIQLQTLSEHWHIKFVTFESLCKFQIYIWKHISVMIHRFIVPNHQI